MNFTLESVPKGQDNATSSMRGKAYRERKGNAYRNSNRERMRKTRATEIPRFIGVDSEGIGRGENHRAVLLGVGDEQYVASNLRAGLQWAETFEFLYRQFEADPKAVYVGFFLGYDFDQWLKSLPEHAAWLLFKGKSIRTKLAKSKTGGVRETTFPVRVAGWEFDMLGKKRLSIRPRPCACDRPICEHPNQNPWMHVCDAGPFFQKSFLGVLDPNEWKDDPDGPVCDQKTYDRIARWKAKRSEFARISKGMRDYNIEENRLLSRIMERLAKGFAELEIRPAKGEWYGPGAVAAKWLKQKGVPIRKDVAGLVEEPFLTYCRRSFFGGWFDIFSHGLIRGESWNYDINSAYPYATSKLPHLCNRGRYNYGRGPYKGRGSYVLLYCTVRTKGDRIGAVPFRDNRGRGYRPTLSRGWYWRSEIDAARRAGIVDAVETHEWAEFVPCSHENILSEISDLYDRRLRVGKGSALGMAIKLVINSVYGKFAQCVGSAPYNNWLYASLITASCRTQILDAIATHPGKANSVLMVATDGICFDSRHPSLGATVDAYIAETGKKKDDRLGYWDESLYTDLCLFKPGVYWHKEGKENLKLKVKSRGVPRAEFEKNIEDTEAIFRKYSGRRYCGKYMHNDIPRSESEAYEPWPSFTVNVAFRMKSCRAAINEGHWERAGRMMENFPLWQTSDPREKRRAVVWNSKKKRVDSLTRWPMNLYNPETTYHEEFRRPAVTDLGVGFDGDVRSDILEMIAAVRDRAVNYDTELGDHEYEN